MQFPAKLNTAHGEVARMQIDCRRRNTGNSALFSSIYRFKVQYKVQSTVQRAQYRGLANFCKKYSKIEEENDIFLLYIIKIYNASS